MNGPILKGSRVQCCACGELFSSVATFDRHRIGEFAGVGGTNTRRCMTVAEMTAQEWPKTAKGFWLRPAPKAIHSASYAHCAAPAAQRPRQEEGRP
jgi:hypothetical protein